MTDGVRQAVIPDTQPRPLPDGWRWVRLGEVCEMNPRRPSDLLRADDHPTTLVPMQAVDETRGAITRPELRPFREVRRGFTYFAENDVLFAKITPCMQNGKHAIARGLAGGFGFGSTEFHVLRAGPGITPEWIHFFIRQPAVLEDAKAYFTGAVGQQRVPETYLAELEIPLPPVERQRRTAAILNEQMAAVERARAAAETQLEAAKALPTAYLRAVFSSPEAQQWPSKSIGELCQLVNGDAYKESDWSCKGVPIIRIQNLNDISKPFNYWAGLLHDRVVVEPGNVLLAWSGTPGTSFGVHLWKRGSGVLNQHIFRVDFHDDQVLPEWAVIAINHLLHILIGKAHGGVGLRHVTKHEVESLEIALPPLEEQKRIAAILEEQMASAERTRKAIEEELDTINKLPAALLRRAFSGEL